MDVDGRPEEGRLQGELGQDDSMADMALPLCTLDALAGLLEEDCGPEWEIPISVQKDAGKGLPSKVCQASAELLFELPMSLTGAI